MQEGKPLHSPIDCKNTEGGICYGTGNSNRLSTTAYPSETGMVTKGTFGKVHILAGSVGFTGAPAWPRRQRCAPVRGWCSSVPQEIWPVLAVKCQAMPAPVPPIPNSWRR